MPYSKAGTMLIDINFHYGKEEEMIVKEFSLLRSFSLAPITYLFKAPYLKRDLTFRDKIRASIRRDKIHKLDWTAGDEEYKYFYDLMRWLDSTSTITNILVKDAEKAYFLQRYSSKVAQLTEMLGDFEDYEAYVHPCQYHRSTFKRCACHHVLQMQMFLSVNKLYE